MWVVHGLSPIDMTGEPATPEVFGAARRMIADRCKPASDPSDGDLSDFKAYIPVEEAA